MVETKLVAKEMGGMQPMLGDGSAAVGKGWILTGVVDLTSGLKAVVRRAREELAIGSERDICSLGGGGAMVVAAMTGSSI